MHAAAELTRIIAGSIDGLFVLIAGDVHRTRLVSGSAIPTLAGHGIGGFAFVAALSHAQVASGQA